MSTASHPIQTASKTNQYLPALVTVLGVIAFSAVFVLLDNAYYRLASARFPAVGASTGLATLWGVVSRAHLLVLCVPLVLWRPRLFGPVH